MATETTAEQAPWQRADPGSRLAAFRRFVVLVGAVSQAAVFVFPLVIDVAGYGRDQGATAASIGLVVVAGFSLAALLASARQHQGLAMVCASLGLVLLSALPTQEPDAAYLLGLAMGQLGLCMATTFPRGLVLLIPPTVMSLAIGVVVIADKPGVSAGTAFDHAVIAVGFSTVMVVFFRTLALTLAQVDAFELSRMRGEATGSTIATRRVWQVDALVHATVIRLLKSVAATPDVTSDLADQVAECSRGLRSLRVAFGEARSGQDLRALIASRLPSRLRSEIDVVTGGEARLSPSVLMAVLNAIDEAARNALTHGRANHLKVDLRLANEAIYGRVVDDGSGACDWRPGHGLLLTRDSIEALGGELVVGPGEAGGFEVEFVIADDQASLTGLRANGSWRRVPRNYRVRLVQAGSLWALTQLVVALRHPWPDAAALSSLLALLLAVLTVAVAWFSGWRRVPGVWGRIGLPVLALAVVGVGVVVGGVALGPGLQAWVFGFAVIPIGVLAFGQPVRWTALAVGGYLALVVVVFTGRPELGGAIAAALSVSIPVGIAALGHRLRSIDAQAFRQLRADQERVAHALGREELARQRGVLLDLLNQQAVPLIDDLPRRPGASIEASLRERAVQLERQLRFELDFGGLGDAELSSTVARRLAEGLKFKVYNREQATRAARAVAVRALVPLLAIESSRQLTVTFADSGRTVRLDIRPRIEGGQLSELLAGMTSSASARASHGPGFSVVEFGEVSPLESAVAGQR